MEENAICLVSTLNNNFVEQFATLNIKLMISEVDGWLQTDCLGHVHIDEKQIVGLVSGPEEVVCD